MLFRLTLRAIPWISCIELGGLAALGGANRFACRQCCALQKPAFVKSITRGRKPTVAAVIIEPLGFLFSSGGKTQQLLRLLSVFPQHFLTQVVQYLAMQRYEF
jgi:hypothetical protein